MRKSTKPRLRYTHELGAEICRRMAEGESVLEIARTPGFPTAGCIFRWGTDTDHPFSQMYARARELYAHKVAAEIIELADAGEARMANVELLRVRIDARKWAASKMMPKDYGDRIRQDVNATVQVKPPRELSDEELARIAITGSTGVADTASGSG